MTRGARGGAEGARRSAPHPGSDWLDGRITAADAIACAKMLKEAGWDYVDVSSGGVAAEARNPPGPGYNVDIAAGVRREAAVATRTVGMIVTPRQAEAIVADGKADMVALGRAALDDPPWAWHAARALGGSGGRSSTPAPPRSCGQATCAITHTAKPAPHDAGWMPVRR